MNTLYAGIRRTAGAIGATATGLCGTGAAFCSSSTGAPLAPLAPLAPCPIPPASSTAAEQRQPPPPSSTTSPPPPFRVWRRGTATSPPVEVPLREVVQACASHDVLFLGEVHDDPTAHLLEYALFRALSKNSPRLTATAARLAAPSVAPAASAASAAPPLASSSSGGGGSGAGRGVVLSLEMFEADVQVREKKRREGERQRGIGVVIVCV